MMRLELTTFSMAKVGGCSRPFGLIRPNWMVARNSGFRFRTSPNPEERQVLPLLPHSGSESGGRELLGDLLSRLVRDPRVYLRRDARVGVTSEH
jgi:hypothetical protein